MISFHFDPNLSDASAGPSEQKYPLVASFNYPYVSPIHIFFYYLPSDMAKQSSCRLYPQRRYGQEFYSNYYLVKQGSILESLHHPSKFFHNYKKRMQKLSKQ